jgi:hypothetical protein
MSRGRWPTILVKYLNAPPRYTYTRPSRQPTNQWCGSGSGSRSVGSNRFMEAVEAEVEAPKNMSLPLPVCFKVAVKILVDACWLEFFILQFLGAKSTSIRDCVCWLVGPSVGPSVPHDAITWKTSYVAIASRRGGGRGKLVMSRFHYVAIPLYLEIRRSPCCSIFS